MDDDFNTPRVLALLFELASKNTEEAASSILAIGKVLGLFSLEKPSSLQNNRL